MRYLIRCLLSPFHHLWKALWTRSGAYRRPRIVRQTRDPSVDANPREGYRALAQADAQPSPEPIAAAVEPTRLLGGVPAPGDAPPEVPPAESPVATPAPGAAREEAATRDRPPSAEPADAEPAREATSFTPAATPDAALEPEGCPAGEMPELNTPLPSVSPPAHEPAPTAPTGTAPEEAEVSAVPAVTPADAQPAVPPPNEDDSPIEALYIDAPPVDSEDCDDPPPAEVAPGIVAAPPDVVADAPVLPNGLLPEVHAEESTVSAGMSPAPVDGNLPGEDEEPGAPDKQAERHPADDEGPAPPSTLTEAEGLPSPTPTRAPTGGSAPQDRRCKIHVEIFVASRLLAARRPIFTRQELYQKVVEVFDDSRPGVASYIHSSRFLANRVFQSRYVFNYLWDLDGGLLRCFDPERDAPVRSRLNATSQPPAEDVPPRYLDLLRAVRTAPLTPLPPGPLGGEDEEGGGAARPQMLGGWERRLRAARPETTMLYQLDLSLEDTRQIAALIQHLVQTRGAPRALRRLSEYYPVTLLTCLTFQGIWGYANGNYWGAACRALGLEYAAPTTADWGGEYVRLCAGLGLRTDVDAEDANVDVILFQGGIPASLLPVFFEAFLLPIVSRPDWSSMSAGELIAEWLAGPARRSMPQPLRRFLQFGGEAAEGFVAGCRQMVLRADGAGDQPAGVPRYVFEAYERWRASGSVWGDAEPPSGGGENAGRLVAPRLAYAPWGL